jgi:hypothetical protein
MEREEILGFEKPLQELSVGEILDQTFKVYFSKFFLFRVRES